MIDESRVIRVRSAGAGDHLRVRAAIEDRFHHFRFCASLDGEAVRSASVEPIRFPYTLCPAAGDRVTMLVGTSRSMRMSDYAGVLDARHQCTHQFDVASLALALAARGVVVRRYDIRVRMSDDTYYGSVVRDGRKVLSMDCKYERVIAPAAFEGRLLGSGFTAWTAQVLDPEAAEEALLLRRMMFIARDSQHAHDYERAFSAPPFKGCWVQQPERNESAQRLKGRLLPHDYDRSRLTSEDDAFLARV